MADVALQVDSLSAWYGEARALTDVSLDVAPGEVVTLVGRNGAGKTTTLKSVMGIVARRTGNPLGGSAGAFSCPQSPLLKIRKRAFR